MVRIRLRVIETIEPMNYNNSSLRVLPKEELDSILRNLKIDSSFFDFIKEHYFQEGTHGVNSFTFKDQFVKGDFNSNEIEIINPYLPAKLKYYATTEPDLNLEYTSPELLKLFLVSEKIVFFIGAGLSRIIGYSSWEELANSAIDKLELNYYSKERIKNSVKDPLQKLSIFETDNDHKSDTYKNFYSNTFSPFNDKVEKKRKVVGNPYDIIVSKEFKAAFITTNIDVEILEALKRRDTLIDDFLKIKVTDKIQRLPHDNNYLICNDYDSLAKDKVVMIHGKYDEADKIIMSNFDYIKEYYRSEKQLPNFLKKVFKQETVIFIGYGLSELPILETIFDLDESKKAEDKAENEIKHYLLFDSFEHEKKLQETFQNYFSKFKIQIIPYHLDENGFDRIYNVLESWKKLIQIESERMTNDAISINSLIDEGKIEQVVNMVKLDDSMLLFNIFFKNIESTECFQLLKENEFFNPLAIINQKNENHLAHLPLYYLEKVTSQLLNEGDLNNPIFNDALLIIKEITAEYIKKQFLNLSGSVFWFCLLIIKHVPNNFISKDYIQTVIIPWIENLDMSNDLHGSIIEKLVPKFLTTSDILKSELILTVHIQRRIEFDKVNEFNDLELRHLIKDHSNFNFFLENCSSHFINHLSDNINYLRIKDHWIRFEFEHETVNYKYEAFLTKNKRIKYSLKEIVTEHKLKEGYFSIKKYSDEDEIREKVIDSLSGYPIKDPSIINLNYFLHWGISSDHMLKDGIFNKRTHEKDIVNILCNLLKRILIAKSKIRPKQLLPIFEKYFDKGYSIPFFKQVTLPAIEANFEFYSDFFGDKVLNEEYLNSDTNYGFAKDVRTFVARNYQYLKLEHIEKLERIINKIEPSSIELPEEQLRGLDFRKLEWLEALQKHDSFKGRYSVLKNKYNLKSDHFSSEGKTSFYGETSRYSVEDLINFSVQDRFNAIADFRQKDHFDWSNGTVRGLSQAVRSLTEQYPIKAIELLKYDNKIPFPYMEGIIEGLNKIYEKDEIEISFNEQEVFDLIYNYLLLMNQNKQKLIVPCDYDSEKCIEWIIRDTADLIETVIKKQKGKCIYYSTLADILKFVARDIEFLTGDSYTEVEGKQYRDYNLNYLLNSSKGKVLLSLFEVAWYRYLVEKQKKIDGWIVEAFEKAFELNIRDAFILLGSYIPQLLSMDKKISQQWINRLDLVNDEGIKCFIGGFLFFQMQYCTKELYLKIRKYFIRAIELDFYEENFRNSGLIRAILLAYYWDYEKITDEVFQKLLKHASVETLSKFQHYIFMDTSEFKGHDSLDSFRLKVLELWNTLKDTFSHKAGGNIGKYNFELFEFVHPFDDLKEEVNELMLFSLNYYNPELHARRFIEEMERLSTNDSNALNISGLLSILSDKKYKPFSESKLGGEIYDLCDKLILLKNGKINASIRETCQNLWKNTNGLHDRPLQIIKKIDDQNSIGND